MVKLFLSILLVTLLNMSLGYSEIQQEELWEDLLLDDGEQHEKCYGLIFDAGSSSTKSNLYDWPCRDQDTIPQIDPQDTEQLSQSPGLATFANNLDGIQGYLQPLIDQAGQKIPENRKQFTPIMLFGTAGFRLIPLQDATKIMDKVAEIFSKSGFLYKREWVRVITGQQEGAFLWIGVNYLLDNLKSQDGEEDDTKTAASIDLGGASTQLTFLPDGPILNEYNVQIDFPNYNSYQDYSVSYLKYGNDQIRNIVVKEYGNWLSDTLVESPCFNSGYSGLLKKDGNITVKGTGKPEECIQQIQNSFHKEKCTVLQQVLGCSIQGKFQSKIPSTQKIYALSGIYYAASFFDLDKDKYTPETLGNKYQEFCNKTWNQVTQEYDVNDKLPNNCFLGLYSYTLLTKGYNLSITRYVESPKKIDGVGPSWTLGAMFYQVSNIPCNKMSPLCQTINSLQNFKIELNISE